MQHLENDAPDFELGEDAPRNRAARLAQDARWASSNIDARHHFSVREATQVYRPAILDAQEDFYTVRLLVRAQRRHPGSLFARLSPDLLSLVVDFAMPGQGPLVLVLHAREHDRAAHVARRRAKDAAAPFRVFVRVRPLLSHERLERQEYEAIDYTSAARAIVCHDGRLARSGRRLTMTHKFYACDAVWQPTSSGSMVFQGALSPLLTRCLSGVGDGTLICYGQTGAGKTHTLVQMLQQVATHLPASRDDGDHPQSTGHAGDEASTEDGAVLELSFFELAGPERASGGAYDLLRDRAPLRLFSNAEGTTQVRGAAAVRVRTGPELLEALRAGFALRSTQATERNPISSRSHAVCSLRFLRPPGARTLRLVDLAGSERNYETHRMTAAEHRESAAINKALFAVKECFRMAAKARDAECAAADSERSENGQAEAAPAGAATAAAEAAEPEAEAGGGEGEAEEAADVDAPGAPAPASASSRIRVPFRASALTRVLRECFTDRTHRTAIIAAVAPGSTDMIHTLNTLDHVTLMAPHLRTAAEAGQGQGQGAGSHASVGGRGAKARAGAATANGKAAPGESGAPGPEDARLPAAAGYAAAATAAATAAVQSGPAGALQSPAAPSSGSVTSSPAFAITLDVPMRRRRRAEGGDAEALSYERVPVHLWTEEHVRAWIANAHGGRFSQVVLPAGTDGRKLLNLSARRLTEMVEDDERTGRGAGAVAGPAGPPLGPQNANLAAAPAHGAGGAGPGPGAQAAAPGVGPGEVSWYISSSAKIGRALFAALRDEQRGRPMTMAA